jgi:hypothetical protein
VPVADAPPATDARPREGRGWLMHIQRRCTTKACRRAIPLGARTCRGCGSRRFAYGARYVDPSGRERSESFARAIDAEAFVLTQEAGKARGDAACAGFASLAWEAEQDYVRSGLGSSEHPVALHLVLEPAAVLGSTTSSSKPAGTTIRAYPSGRTCSCQRLAHQASPRHSATTNELVVRVA